MGQNCNFSYSTTAKHRKRLNWLLILQFFTSDYVKFQFQLYNQEHKKIKSVNRQVHNFLLHWFGKDWCARWQNSDFYDEATLVRELNHMCELHDRVRNAVVIEDNCVYVYEM